MQLSGHRLQLTLLTTLLAIALLGLTALTATSASAKTFVVNKTGDHAPGICDPSDCTLREAVIAATAKLSNDKIKLPATKPYKLKRDPTLPGPDETSGDLDVGVALGPGNITRIVHPGSGRAKIDVTATGDSAISVLGNLRLIRIKVTGGTAATDDQSGGGIHASGTLLLKDTKLVGNSAGSAGGGLYMFEGLMVAIDSTFRRNAAEDGGGLFAEPEANVSLIESTVVGNLATGSGGGAFIATDLSNGFPDIDRSTITDNAAGSDGGAVYADAGTLVIENSTLARNEADGRGGAIYSAPDSLTRMNAVTVARNRGDADGTAGPDSGGGIFADGGSDVVEMRNSLLAENILGAGAGTVNECDAPAPVGISSLGGNLLTATSGGCTFLDDPEDVLAANPGIKELAANGGPTKTIALKASSPAIDEADGPSPTTFDQRGEARDDADIGAYER